MLESYTLMYKDIEVGIITYDEKLDKFAFELNKNIKIKIIYPLYKQGEINENYKDTIIIKTLNRKQTEISLVGIDLNKCIDYISS